MKPILWSEVSFDAIADALADYGFVIIDGFLNADEIHQLREAIFLHQEEDNFKKAGIGNTHLLQVDKDIRGDYIKWIEPEDALPISQHFLNRIEDIRQQLNRSLFLSLKDFECHYAIYPPGTFYEAHLDQFKSGESRKISIACYLNQDWTPEQGGELGIHLEDGILKVEPLAGRIALFRSDTILHEVMRSHAQRFSITGWLRDQPLDLPYL